MIRLWWVITVLLLLLWVPVALLVRHALSNVEAERRSRHQAVAERLFDELERELSEWLQREEERPFGQYRFLYLSDDQEPLPQRSPLADGPEVSFVFAHFQIEPDGSVTSPLWPSDPDRADRVLGWRMGSEQEQQRDEILQVLSDIVLHRTPRSVSSQAPGTTVEVDRSSRQELARLRTEQTRGLLSRLNRGLASRSGRTTQVQQSQVQNVLDFAESKDVGELSSKLSKIKARRQTPATENEELDDLRLVVDVSLEPMVGRDIDGSFMLLYRTVVIGDRAFRQGMVVDGEGLVDWLAERVLRSPVKTRGPNSLERNRDRDRTKAPTQLALPGVAVRWQEASAVAGGPTQDAERFAFKHRFAEPFSSVAAQVELEPLPEPAVTLYIYFLAVLLGLSSTLGVWALYRTVAARLRFAERQSNFVSAVTHELKTPLTAIRMHGEMLRDGVVPSEEKRQTYYRVLTSEAERLTRLIDNVLELSQIEKQTRRFDLRPGDVREVLREVAEVLQPHALKLGFTLEVEDNGPADAIFDADALAQVLFNLVDNALKYAKKAEHRTVILRSESRGQEVCLVVADHGPGVPGKQLGEVFEPFFRGESEMTRTTKGTGIGLALVRGLVEPMGGSVKGRNRDGGGFAVEIRLPAAKPEPI